MTPQTPTLASVAANVTAIRARIAAAATRAGRDPASVTLIAVSKTFPAVSVRAAIEAGVLDLGENRVQEGSSKRAELEASAGTNGAVPARWHLIGHLQSNKVKAALASFDILHTLDSVRLAEIVDRLATSPVDVLLEVNVGGEASKFGFHPDEVLAAAERIGRLPNLRLRGLMTVAPAVDDPERVRPVFRRLRALRDAAGLVDLSMGMTHDFEVAVEEGATMVRAGRAIFGERTAYVQ
jgi:PLP dependent protein